MCRSRPPLAFALSLALSATAASLADPKFISSQIHASASEVIFGEFGGEHLKDLVLWHGTNLWLSVQEAKGVFAAEPRLIYHADKPCVFWPARFGRETESFLVLDQEGIKELWLTNRTGKPLTRQVLQARTVLPDKGMSALMNLRLSLGTGGDWPLLLVPTKDGLQVWQHQAQQWFRKQTLESALAADVFPSVRTLAYTRQFGFQFSAFDINHDGREDLMVCRPRPAGAVYEFYLQEADGTLRLQQSFAGMDRPDWQNWLCWLDINHDGQLDLIKSTWPDEPWFIPGSRAGKVFVSIYLADEQGRLPAQPQQVLRKNDWNPALPVVDVDGDGFPDLILSYGQFDSRDAVRKMISTRRMDLALKLFYYRPGSGFASEGDAQRMISFHIDIQGIEMNLGKPPELQRFVELTGDFNGDGKKDLLVKERYDELVAYFFVSREKGFSDHPDLRFNCGEPIDAFTTADLNGDGISDVIVKLRQGLRVFMSTK